ncbi:MAG: hypothetical protein M3Z64_07050, partial [Verrucomicrobiota bacterium]|nr:hypothetical protein [Verrucomicrobiota bacterium]
MKVTRLATSIIAILFAVLISSAAAQGLGAAMTSASPTPEESRAVTPAEKEAKPVAKPEGKPVAPSEKPPVTAQTNMVQKIPGAGLQFEVPKAWQITEVAGPIGPAYRLL